MSRELFEATLKWDHCTSNVRHERRGNTVVSQIYYVYFAADGRRVGAFHFAPTTNAYLPGVCGYREDGEVREYFDIARFERPFFNEAGTLNIRQ